MTYSLAHAAKIATEPADLLALGWKRTVHHDHSETWESPCGRFRRHSRDGAKRCQAQLSGTEFQPWVEAHPRAVDVKQQIRDYAAAHGCDFIQATYGVYVRLSTEGRLHV